MSFTTSYAKEKVTGRIGHSVTFVWKFSDGVDTITWGLKKDGVDNINKVSGRLLSLDRRGVNTLPSNSVPLAYRSRVNGTRTDDSSSGQASFTLYNVTKDDERFYGCFLSPDDPNTGEITDLVQLVVVGMFRKYKPSDSRTRSSLRVSVPSPSPTPGEKTLSGGRVWLHVG